MTTDNTRHQCLIPKLEIIRTAEALTLRYRDLVGEGRAALGIDFNCVFDDLIYPDYEVALTEHMDLGHDEAGNKVLGQYVAETNDLYLDPTLRSDPRRVFTQWHEIGHVVLHGNWIRRLAKLGDMPGLIQTTALSLRSATFDALEIQANLFASQAAAPDWLLVGTFKRRVGDRPLTFQGPGKYTFPLNCGTQERHAQDFTEFCWILAGYLKGCFASLSQEALGYRIHRSTIVKNQDRTSTSFKLNRVARKSNSFALPIAMFR